MSSGKDLDTSNRSSSRFLSLVMQEIARSQILGQTKEIRPKDLAQEIALEAVVRFLEAHGFRDTSACAIAETRGTLTSRRNDRWLQRSLRSGERKESLKPGRLVEHVVAWRLSPEERQERRVQRSQQRLARVKVVKKGREPVRPILMMDTFLAVEPPSPTRRRRTCEVERMMRVSVTVCEARNLIRTDLIGSSDPFVELKLPDGTVVGKTRVMEDTLTPIWNEVFAVECMSGTKIEANIWDKDYIGKDELLATYHIPITRRERCLDDWFSMSGAFDATETVDIKLIVDTKRK